MRLSLKSRSYLISEGMFLGLLVCYCFTCSLTRCYLTGESTFLFLNWNLFLAAVPWILSKIALKMPSFQTSKYLVFILLGVWLLFFPNAPYILTDLFHLRQRPSIPIWFDLLMILSFAWTGLLFGFLSLRDLENILKKKFNKSKISLLIITLLFVCGFGIYLGRYLRWNSWDILYEPLSIAKDVFIRFSYPLENLHTWGMTLLMGIFLNIVYFSLKLLEWNTNKKQALSKNH